MKKNTFIIAAVSTVAVATASQSCVALATSSIGLAIIKKVLLGGISHYAGIFKNKDAFLNNNLINNALPSQLVSLNNILQRVAPSLVEKEKNYIAETAAYTVGISQPILSGAVENLTANDLTRISQGTSATQIIKEKTQAQLIAAMMPKVDEKLNQFGLVHSLNSALSGDNMLSGLFGGTQAASPAAPGGISKLATEQMVSGIFMLMENYEKQNESEVIKALRGRN